MEEFDLDEMIDLSDRCHVTFVFDKWGLVMSTVTLDQDTAVLSEKKYGRRFETEMLRRLDMSLKELVDLFLADAERYWKSSSIQNG